MPPPNRTGMTPTSIVSTSPRSSRRRPWSFSQQRVSTVHRPRPCSNLVRRWSPFKARAATAEGGRYRCPARQAGAQAGENVRPAGCPTTRVRHFRAAPCRQAQPTAWMNSTRLPNGSRNSKHSYPGMGTPSSISTPAATGVAATPRGRGPHSRRKPWLRAVRRPPPCRRAPGDHRSGARNHLAPVRLRASRLREVPGVRSRRLVPPRRQPPEP
jgi:hypothetical protein